MGNFGRKSQQTGLDIRKGNLTLGKKVLARTTKRCDYNKAVLLTLLLEPEDLL